MTLRSFPPHHEWQVVVTLTNNTLKVTILIDGKPMENQPPDWTLTWLATSEVRMDS